MNTGELVLMNVPAPLAEIVSDGHKRFAMPGRVVAVVLHVDDGSNVHELTFTDSDAASSHIGPWAKT